jgi:FkbM family methyltransferase
VVAPIGPQTLLETTIIAIYEAVLGRPPLPAELTAAQELPTPAMLGAKLLDTIEFHRLRKTLDYYDRWAQIEIFGGTALIWINLRDKFVSFGCLIDNYEPAESVIFKQLVQSGDVVIDVGANIGWYSLLGSTLVGPGGRLLAFEPNPPVNERLAMSVQANAFASNIEIFDVALSDRRGTATLAVGSSRNLGAAFLSNDDAGGEVAYTVRLMTLDGLIADGVVELDRLNFIKIDVEGHEGFALEGSKDTISRCRPIILSEFSEMLLARSGFAPERLFSFLEANSYEIFRLGLSGREPSFPRENIKILTRQDMTLSEDIISVLLVPRERVSETFGRL